MIFRMRYRNWLTLERMQSIGYQFGWAAVSSFLLSSLLRFYVHPSGGHTHRQSDTIGLSMRFAHELESRGVRAFDFLWVPRILQGGLSNGINACEFPLLNVLTGPFFIFFTPQWAVFFASCFVLGIQIATAHWIVPKLLRIFKINLTRKVDAYLLWFSPLVLGWQSNLLMPEGLALPLVLWGIVLLIEAPLFSAAFLGGWFLTTLGVAVKPTVAVCLALMLPKVLEEVVENKPRGKNTFFWKTVLSLTTLGFPFYWYVVHLPELLKMANGPQVFMRAEFHPIQNWLALGLSGSMDLLFKQIHMGGFPIFFGWIWIGVAFAMKQWLFLLLYLVTIFVIIGLDGTHLFQHSYYFVGTGIFSLLLMGKCLAQIQPSKKGLAPLFVLIWGVIYHTRTNIWSWARDSDYFRKNPYRLAEKVNSLIPKTYAVVTDDTTYPTKLLYLNRIGKAGGDHPEVVCESDSYKNLNIAFLIDESRPFSSEFCLDRKISEWHMGDDQEKWKIILVSQSKDSSR